MKILFPLINVARTLPKKIPRGELNFRLRESALWKIDVARGSGMRYYEPPSEV